MNKTLFICTTLLLSCISLEPIFALGCDIKMELPTTSKLTTAVDRCIQARPPYNKENPNSITEFVCPQGEMFVVDEQTINPETLAYRIAVQIAFDKVDEEIIKYMKSLRQIREPDINVWQKNANECRKKISSIYDSICTFGTLEKILNAGDKKYITSTMAYPQGICIDLASRKIKGWEYLQNILMSDSVGKNHKNSTDVWTNTVKGNYTRILNQWHNYQKILARSVGKMTGYIKDPI